MSLKLPKLLRSLLPGQLAHDELPSLRELKAAQTVSSNRRSMDERNAEAARRLEAAMSEGAGEG
jgi:hypothetical protein